LIIASGSSIGTIIASVTCPYIMDRLGWPWVFYASGFLGILWTYFWILFASDTPQTSKTIHPIEEHFIITRLEAKQCLLHINAIEDADEALKTPTPVSNRAAIRLLFKSGGLYALAAFNFLSGWGFYVMLNYLPTYLRFIEVDISIAVLNPLACAGSCYLAGALYNLFLSRGMSTLKTMKILIGLGMMLPSLAVLTILFVPLPAIAIGIILPAGVGLLGFSSPVIMLNVSMLAPKHSSILCGITNMAANIPGIIGIYTTGSILAASGSWLVVFSIPILCNTLGMVLFWALGSSSRVV